MTRPNLATLLLLPALAGCGPSSGSPFDAGPGIDPDLAPLYAPFDIAATDEVHDLRRVLPVPDLVLCEDRDHDGVGSCAGDCDDEDPRAHPGAAELCDGIDDNCDGRIDEGFDADGDGWTTCAGDCDDGAPSVHPGALPRCNGQDNNCNGKRDDVEDGDADADPACSDCNDADPLVGGGAMEVPGDHIDNNCNGVVDEPLPACDPGQSFHGVFAPDYARALDVCPDAFFRAASFPTAADARAHSIPSSYGLLKPHGATTFAVLSTGIAAASGQPQYVVPQEGTKFVNELPNPYLMGNNCGGPDAQTVADMTELKLELKVPQNAKSFSFDFYFLSAEYPEWVCSRYNDKFLALLSSKQWNGNVSFDKKGAPVTINNAFFTVTKAADLLGTGYDVVVRALVNGNFINQQAGAGTGWLTTTAPVTPGEVITLRFIVFDEGDHVLDSAVLLDNFRWSLQPALNGPSTDRTM